MSAKQAQISEIEKILSLLPPHILLSDKKLPSAFSQLKNKLDNKSSYDRISLEDAKELSKETKDLTMQIEGSLSQQEIPALENLFSAVFQLKTKLIKDLYSNNISFEDAKKIAVQTRKLIDVLQQPVPEEESAKNKDRLNKLASITRYQDEASSLVSRVGKNLVKGISVLIGAALGFVVGTILGFPLAALFLTPVDPLALGFGALIASSVTAGPLGAIAGGYAGYKAGCFFTTTTQDKISNLAKEYVHETNPQPSLFSKFTG